jgi:hypothetical protein
VPFAPDSNLVCLAINPRGNTSIAAMNDFVRQLHEQMKIDPNAPLQLREFFGSTTTLRVEALGRDGSLRLLQRLHLPPVMNALESERESLLILRHTIMKKRGLRLQAPVPSEARNRP